MGSVAKSAALLFSRNVSIALDRLKPRLTERGTTKCNAISWESSSFRRGEEVSSFTLSNMITKRKRIAIAPTYTIRKIKAKNSACTDRYKRTVLKKTVIKHSRLWTGCEAIITRTAKTRVMAGIKIENKVDQE